MKIIYFIFVLTLLIPPPAFAYLDPGAGSYLFQLIIAGLLGSLFFLKNIMRRIKDFVASISQKKQRRNEKKN